VAVLRIHAPVLGREERIFPWDGRPITVGRDESCDVVLLEQAASRRHARFEREGDEIRVIDCDSGNGVWVGEERVVGSRVLHDGEVVRIGETTLTLVLDPHRQPTVIGATVEAGGAKAAIEVEAPSATPAVEVEAPSATPVVEAPSAAPVVEAPAPPAFVPPRRPAPMPVASSLSAYSLGSEPTLASQSGPNILGVHERSAPSTYSIGSEPTLASQSGPNILGIHERSAPSTYSIGEAPTIAPRSGPSDRPLASSSSVYSLGDAPAAASRGPDDLGRHRPSAGSAYSLGHEPTLAPSRGPDALGSHRASTGSTYSLGHEPVASPRGPDSLGSHRASTGSTYSLGHEPVAPSRGPESLGSHRASTDSTYSLGHEPVAPSRGPDALLLGPSSASEYSLGDPSTARFRGPDVLPPAPPSFDGATSSSQLGGAPPRPGAMPPLAAPALAPPRIDSPPRPPALVAPGPARSAASSWGEWAGPLPSEHRPRRRAPGATLWLGLGLFLGGLVAMIASLVAGYDPSELRALADPSVVLGGER
jgi:hypothetical protein